MPSFSNITAELSETEGTASYEFTGRLFNSIDFASSLVDGQQYGYVAYYADNSIEGIEVGRGTWFSATGLFTRDVIETSSNSNLPVSWLSGEKIVEIVVTQNQYTDLSNQFANNVYIHNQAISSATWTINHNLGFRPNITITDSSGDECEGDVDHPSLNQAIINFSAAFTGTARLN